MFLGDLWTDGTEQMILQDKLDAASSSNCGFQFHLSGHPGAFEGFFIPTIRHGPMLFTDPLNHDPL